MLTCSLSASVISINVTRQLNAQHVFSVSFFYGRSSYPVGAEVAIYRGEDVVLDGVVTSCSYDAAAGIMTISGQDKLTYQTQHDAKPTELIKYPVGHSLTVKQAINSVARALAEDWSIDMAPTCPNITCYGYGSYNGSTHSFIERVCSSFGLDYCAGDTGYSITRGGIDTPSQPTVYPASAISESSDASRIISDIYVQRAITRSQRQELNVKNSSLSSTMTARLVNPHAVEAPQGAAQFPKDYWLDPWQKCFVTIDVPVATVVYSVPVQISAAKKIIYASCTDTLVQPAWRLEVWDGNPGTGALPAANRLAYLTTGQTWTAQGSETAYYLRIARDIQTDNGAVTTYPTYDGVEIKCYTWPTLDAAEVLPWSGSYSSGDEDGRPDYNVISESMYPPKAQFDGQALGPQIARRDSVSKVRSITLPYMPDVDILSGVASVCNGSSYPLPVTSMTLTEAAGVEQTLLQGEW